jgi:hypothetical protein
MRRVAAGGSLLGGALLPQLSRATRALLDSDHDQRVLTLDIDGGDATAPVGRWPS